MSERSTLRVAVAQLPFAVGEIAANTRRTVAAIRSARDDLGADWVVFPELNLTGYPPDDLLERADFLAAAEAALAEVATACTGITAVVGLPLRAADGALYNAAVLLADTQRQAVAYKSQLPSYGVFDDNRHFTAGTAPCVVESSGWRVALAICEDLWVPAPTRAAAAAGAHLVIAINASPYYEGKAGEREAVAAQRATESGLPIVYVNLVGGHDEVVYDGASFAVDRGGQTTMRAPTLEEALCVVEIAADGSAQGPCPPPLSGAAATYAALVRGTADYVRGNGFTEVVLGLSGGVDSALTAAVAVDALGAERVHAVMLPSRFTAERSLTDAEAVAELLGLDYRVIPIEAAFTAHLEALQPHFVGRSADVAEENLQARIRGTQLMALSNKFGWMLLAAGNKSELAVGYATLYGDMCGGFAPLKDVYKTDVYRLVDSRNQLTRAVPQSVIEREPTAELRADQRDQDSLPPYPLLDAVLRCAVEENQTAAKIDVAGLESTEVERIVRLLYRNEYKRRQAAPGVKVTRRAFGRDRRYPITSGWGGVSG